MPSTPPRNPDSSPPVLSTDAPTAPPLAQPPKPGRDPRSVTLEERPPEDVEASDPDMGRKIELEWKPAATAR